MTCLALELPSLVVAYHSSRLLLLILHSRLTLLRVKVVRHHTTMIVEHPLEVAVPRGELAQKSLQHRRNVLLPNRENPVEDDLDAGRLTVGVGPAEHDVPVVIHQGQISAAGANVGGIGHVDRHFPQFPAGFGVERGQSAGYEDYQTVDYKRRRGGTSRCSTITPSS